MARPQKEGLDYFSHDTDTYMDDKMETLEAVYGNDGYACYFKLLERIYRNGGKVFISDAETMQKYAKRCNISPVDKFEQMVNFMAKTGLFDERSWKSWKILTSNGIAKRAQFVIDKRLRMKDRYNQRVSAAETPQSKVKESKGKESKALPPEKPPISQGEINDLKNLGFNNVKIKDHFLSREYNEAEIDLAMGKVF